MVPVVHVIAFDLLGPLAPSTTRPLVFMAIEGTHGTNRCGSDPHDGETDPATRA